MSQKVFNKIMQGLKQAKAYSEGKREGYKMTLPIAAVDQKKKP